jgi:dihydroxyacetone kinase-like predicted kinase
MYLLEADDDRMGGFKEAWAALGDSIAIVGGDGLWNCHIHTDDIGAAIEAAIDIGRPRQIRVTDLLDQAHAIAEERWVREATGDALVEEPPHVHQPAETAIVAVATGEGIKRLFWSLGVQQVVTGGQSMNPSTAQLLEAVEACPADSVLILPNNKNIIPVAQQVDALTSRSVVVLPTTGITEGLAAAMQYDPAGPLDDNAEAMSEAARSVVSGEVTTAVRDSASDAGPIRVGDVIGIARGGGIVAVAPDLVAAATALLERIVTDAHEIVTVIEGDGSSAATTRAITEWLADHRPGCTAEVHHGGQPLYPYLFGAE